MEAATRHRLLRPRAVSVRRPGLRLSVGGSPAAVDTRHCPASVRRSLNVCFLETRCLSLHHIPKTNVVLLTELRSPRFLRCGRTISGLCSTELVPLEGLRQCTGDVVTPTGARGHTQIPRWDTRGDLCINPIKSTSFVLCRIRTK